MGFWVLGDLEGLEGGLGARLRGKRGGARVSGVQVEGDVGTSGSLGFGCPRLRLVALGSGHSRESICECSSKGLGT